MKKTIKTFARLLMVTLFFTLIGCSEDIYENHIHNENSINKNEISFKQFKGETGIKNFESLKSVNFGNEFNRTIESEFVTDTTKILKYTSINNKVTYSFKIYPITEALESKEYYNLVYEKYGTEWNELIFLNKEKETQQIGESKLESSKMVYNEKLSALSMSGFCEVVNYTIHCDGSCALQGWSECDGFACSTGKCIQESVSYEYCGSSSGSSGNSEVITGPPSGGGGGGNDYSGIYIPNPYDGDADLNNPDFVFATQVAAFTRTLPTNLKNLMTNNFWIYPNIVDFMKNNGGLTQENKDAVVFALTNSIPVFNLSLPNWTFTEIKQLHYNTFIFLLQNPNNTGSDFIQHIVNNGNNLGEVDFVYKVIIDKSLKDNPCLNDVYTQLGKAPTFQYYLQNFDGNFSVANLKLSVGVHPSYPNANAVTSEPQNYLISIMFNPNNLNRPQLDVARTFIHELIHAEIYRKLLSLAGQPYIPWSASFINSIKNDYPGLYDYYLRYIYNVPQGQAPSSAQHQLMAQHYRQIIIDVLQQYDSTQTPDVYNALSWIGLMGDGIFDPSTALYTNSTIAWQNVPQAQRLQIISVWSNFNNSNTPCQP